MPLYDFLRELRLDQIDIEREFDPEREIDYEGLLESEAIPAENPEPNTCPGRDGRSD